MYACICNNLSEEQIRDAALVTGTRCAETVYAYLGKKPDCGCCLERSNAFIEAVLSRPGEEVSLRKVKVPSSRRAANREAAATPVFS